MPRVARQSLNVECYTVINRDLVLVAREGGLAHNKVRRPPTRGGVNFSYDASRSSWWNDCQLRSAGSRLRCKRVTDEVRASRVLCSLHNKTDCCGVWSGIASIVGQGEGDGLTAGQYASVDCARWAA